MELIGLNASYQPVKALTCINIQWNRRYFEAGDFQIQLRAADWDTEIAYIYTNCRPETGIVQKVETEHNIKGDFVLVSGLFLEGLLNWKILYPRFTSAGNVTFACYGMVNLFMADLGVTIPNYTTFSGDDDLDFTGDALGDTMYSLLKELGVSPRISLNYLTGGLEYAIWSGVDRRQSQSVNTYAVFSQGLATVNEMTLTQDSSGYKNYAVVAYDGGVQ